MSVSYHSLAFLIVVSIVSYAYVSEVPTTSITATSATFTHQSVLTTLVILLPIFTLLRASDARRAPFFRAKFEQDSVRTTPLGRGERRGG